MGKAVLKRLKALEKDNNIVVEDLRPLYKEIFGEESEVYKNFAYSKKYTEQTSKT